MRIPVFVLMLVCFETGFAQNTNLSPAEMNAFQNQLIDQKAREESAKREAEKNKPQYAPDPVAPTIVVPQAAAPASGDNSSSSNPVGDSMRNSQEQATKIENEIKNLLNQNPPPEPPKRPGAKGEVVVEKRVKSPFMIPDELYFKIKRKMGEKSQFVAIDETIEVRLRWPLSDYTLVGVLWDTRRPKAMIRDKQGKVHVFREKELIANGGGYIAEISNGEVIVVERGAEIKMQLRTR